MHTHTRTNTFLVPQHVENAVKLNTTNSLDQLRLLVQLRMASSSSSDSSEKYDGFDVVRTIERASHAPISAKSGWRTKRMDVNNARIVMRRNQHIIMRMYMHVRFRRSKGEMT